MSEAAVKQKAVSALREKNQALQASREQADELQRALAALRPLGVAAVAALRAAIASHLRGRLCAGGAVDGVVTALQVSHGPLAWLWRPAVHP